MISSAGETAAACSEQLTSAAEGDSSGLLVMKVKTPELWSPETPALYTLNMTLSAGDDACDRYTCRFGFKDYERKPGNWYVGAYNADSTAILLPDTAGSDFGSHRSTEWTDKCYNNFFFGTVINDFKSENTCKNHIKNTITKEQLLETFRELTTGRNMLVAEMSTRSFVASSP